MFKSGPGLSWAWHRLPGSEGWGQPGGGELGRGRGLVPQPRAGPLPSAVPRAAAAAGPGCAKPDCARLLLARERCGAGGVGKGLPPGGDNPPLGHGRQKSRGKGGISP